VVQNFPYFLEDQNHQVVRQVLVVLPGPLAQTVQYCQCCPQFLVLLMGQPVQLAQQGQYFQYLLVFQLSPPTPVHQGYLECQLAQHLQ